MRLLLDTHIILWWLANAAEMPSEARRFIENADNTIYVSRVSLWEVAIKVSVRKLNVDLADFAEQVEKDGFSWLPIENQHLLRVAELPIHADHKDPFDRLLVSQSQCESAIFITVDKKLARYGETIRVISRK